MEYSNRKNWNEIKSEIHLDIWWFSLFNSDVPENSEWNAVSHIKVKMIEMIWTVLNWMDLLENSVYAARPVDTQIY